MPGKRSVCDLVWTFGWPTPLCTAANCHSAPSHGHRNPTPRSHLLPTTMCTPTPSHTPPTHPRTLFTPPAHTQVHAHTLPHPLHYKKHLVTQAIIPDLAALTWSAVQHMAWPPVLHSEVSSKPDVLVHVVHIHDTLGPPADRVDQELIGSLLKQALGDMQRVSARYGNTCMAVVSTTLHISPAPPAAAAVCYAHRVGVKQSPLYFAHCSPHQCVRFARLCPSALLLLLLPATLPGSDQAAAPPPLHTLLPTPLCDFAHQLCPSYCCCLQSSKFSGEDSFLSLAHCNLYNFVPPVRPDAPPNRPLPPAAACSCSVLPS